ncbi:hypothetical protein DPMN_123185 [Dreissena polymorpha]|uniref:YHYH domain-containing protein n=1 Tax=Dreissena polymorpha TaxID=45954 RepID=A0A9D4JRA5_DREPO|nr:hypothetical protein DPMN_123185 [Dreissena polymorpha]
MNRGTLLVAILLSTGCVCLGQKYALTDEEIDILRQSGITVIIHSNHTLTIEHHGYPNHTFEGGWGDNPNTPSAQNYSVLVPRNATVAAEKGCVYMGPIGLSVSGASFYNPYTGQGNNAVEGSCAETFDNCSGHPSPDGAYHYHKIRRAFTGETISGTNC